ncbi:MAG: hypothetical protein H6899_14750 [Rhodobacter sp.]|nr:hypothetical protein [Rhodobacter sp.]
MRSLLAAAVSLISLFPLTAEAQAPLRRKLVGFVSDLGQAVRGGLPPIPPTASLALAAGRHSLAARS